MSATFSFKGDFLTRLKEAEAQTGVTRGQDITLTLTRPLSRTSRRADGTIDLYSWQDNIPVRGIITRSMSGDSTETETVEQDAELRVLYHIHPCDRADPLPETLIATRALTFSELLRDQQQTLELINGSFNPNQTEAYVRKRYIMKGSRKAEFAKEVKTDGTNAVDETDLTVWQINDRNPAWWLQAVSIVLRPSGPTKKGTHKDSKAGSQVEGQSQDLEEGTPTASDIETPLEWSGPGSLTGSVSSSPAVSILSGILESSSLQRTGSLSREPTRRPSFLARMRRSETPETPGRSSTR